MLLKAHRFLIGFLVLIVCGQTFNTLGMGDPYYHGAPTHPDQALHNYVQGNYQQAQQTYFHQTQTHSTQWPGYYPPQPAMYPENAGYGNQWNQPQPQWQQMTVTHQAWQENPPSYLESQLPQGPMGAPDENSVRQNAYSEIETLVRFFSGDREVTVYDAQVALDHLLYEMEIRLVSPGFFTIGGVTNADGLLPDASLIFFLINACREYEKNESSLRWGEPEERTVLKAMLRKALEQTKKHSQSEQGSHPADYATVMYVKELRAQYKDSWFGSWVVALINEVFSE